ncbi:MAG: spondin domain-containing protein [Gemmatimonadales bacterium]
MSLIRAVSVTAALAGAAVTTAAAQAAQTEFTIRVENITKGETLKLSTGGKAPFVLAPVLWVIHAGNSNPLFAGGQAEMMKGLEQLAEEGNTEPLAKALNGGAGVVSVGAHARPSGDLIGGPLTPGKAYEFTVKAAPGRYLSLAAMFGQSNDWFYSNERPIALFNGSKPVSGDMTPQLSLWDAGTEVDEEPGLGPNQAPRQKSANSGAAEKESVAHVAGKWAPPGVGSLIRVTVTPANEAVSAK